MWSHIAITFSTQDVNLTLFPHTDAMVTTAHIDQWDVAKIIVDNGSQAEILFLSTFQKMGYNKKQLKEPTKPLYDFGGKRIEPIGHRGNNIARFLWHPHKTPHKIHNLRHHRYAISLQYHIWARLIKHFRGCPAFNIPLPQSSSHL
jgi:hypothetical protein